MAKITDGVPDFVLPVRDIDFEHMGQMGDFTQLEAYLKNTTDGVESVGKSLQRLNETLGKYGKEISIFSHNGRTYYGIHEIGAALDPTQLAARMAVEINPVIDGMQHTISGLAHEIQVMIDGKIMGITQASIEELNSMLEGEGKKITEFAKYFQDGLKKGTLGIKDELNRLKKNILSTSPRWERADYQKKATSNAIGNDIINKNTLDMSATFKHMLSEKNSPIAAALKWYRQQQATKGTGDDNFTEDAAVLLTLMQSGHTNREILKIDRFRDRGWTTDMLKAFRKMKGVKNAIRMKGNPNDLSPNAFAHGMVSIGDAPTHFGGFGTNFSRKFSQNLHQGKPANRPTNGHNKKFVVDGEDLDEQVYGTLTTTENDIQNVIKELERRTRAELESTMPSSEITNEMVKKMVEERYGNVYAALRDGAIMVSEDAVADFDIQQTRTSKVNTHELQAQLKKEEAAFRRKHKKGKDYVLTPEEKKGLMIRALERLDPSIAGILREEGTNFEIDGEQALNDHETGIAYHYTQRAKTGTKFVSPGGDARKTISAIIKQEVIDLLLEQKGMSQYAGQISVLNGDEGFSYKQLNQFLMGWTERLLADDTRSVDEIAELLNNALVNAFGLLDEAHPEKGSKAGNVTVVDGRIVSNLRWGEMVEQGGSKEDREALSSKLITTWLNTLAGADVVVEELVDGVKQLKINLAPVTFDRYAQQYAMDYTTPLTKARTDGGWGIGGYRGHESLIVSIQAGEKHGMTPEQALAIREVVDSMYSNSRMSEGEVKQYLSQVRTKIGSGVNKRNAPASNVIDLAQIVGDMDDPDLLLGEQNYIEGHRTHESFMRTAEGRIGQYIRDNNITGDVYIRTPDGNLIYVPTSDAAALVEAVDQKGKRIHMVKNAAGEDTATVTDDPLMSSIGFSRYLYSLRGIYYDEHGTARGSLTNEQKKRLDASTSDYIDDVNNAFKKGGVLFDALQDVRNVSAHEAKLTSWSAREIEAERARYNEATTDEERNRSAARLQMMTSGVQVSRDMAVEMLMARQEGVTSEQNQERLAGMYNALREEFGATSNYKFASADQVAVMTEKDLAQAIAEIIDVDRVDDEGHSLWNGENLAAIMGRFPFSHGEDMKFAGLTVGGTDNHTIRAGAGLIDLVNGDFDGDSILAMLFNLSPEDYAKLKGRISSTIENALLGARKIQKIHDRRAQILAAAKIYDQKPGESSGEMTLTERDLSVLSMDRKARAQAAIAERLGRGYTGRFSNLYQNYHSAMLDMKLTNEGAVDGPRSQQAMAALAVNSLFEALTQEAISSKKILENDTSLADYLNRLESVAKMFSGIDEYDEKKLFKLLDEMGVISGSGGGAFKSRIGLQLVHEMMSIGGDRTQAEENLYNLLHASGSKVTKEQLSALLPKFDENGVLTEWTDEQQKELQKLISPEVMRKMFGFLNQSLINNVMTDQNGRSYVLGEDAIHRMASQRTNRPGTVDAIPKGQETITQVLSGVTEMGPAMDKLTDAIEKLAAIMTGMVGGFGGGPGGPYKKPWEVAEEIANGEAGRKYQYGYSATTITNAINPTASRYPETAGIKAALKAGTMTKDQLQQFFGNSTPWKAEAGHVSEDTANLIAFLKEGGLWGEGKQFNSVEDLLAAVEDPDFQVPKGTKGGQRIKQLLNTLRKTIYGDDKDGYYYLNQYTAQAYGLDNPEQRARHQLLMQMRTGLTQAEAIEGYIGARGTAKPTMFTETPAFGDIAGYGATSRSDYTRTYVDEEGKNVLASFDYKNKSGALGFNDALQAVINYQDLETVRRLAHELSQEDFFKDETVKKMVEQWKKYNPGETFNANAYYKQFRQADKVTQSVVMADGSTMTLDSNNLLVERIIDMMGRFLHGGQTPTREDIKNVQGAFRRSDGSVAEINSYYDQTNEELVKSMVRGKTNLRHTNEAITALEAIKPEDLTEEEETRLKILRDQREELEAQVRLIQAAIDARVQEGQNAVVPTGADSIAGEVEKGLKAAERADKEKKLAEAKKQYLKLLQAEYSYQEQIDLLEIKKKNSSDPGTIAFIDAKIKELKNVLAQIAEAQKALKLSKANVKKLRKDNPYDTIERKGKLNTAEVTEGHNAQVHDEDALQKLLHKRIGILKQIEGAKATIATSFSSVEKNAQENIIETSERRLELLDEEIRKIAERNNLSEAEVKNLLLEYQAEEDAMKAQAAARNHGNRSIWDTIKYDTKRAMMRVTDYGVAMRLINSIPKGLQKIYQLTQQLDEALTNIRIVTGENAQNAHKLMVSYQKLGKELGATTQEVAQSANEWLRQGYSAEEAGNLISSSMKLSKLGMVDSSAATKYLTSALKGFKIEASKAIEIVDRLTKVDMEAAVSAGDIAEGLSRTATSAQLAGLSMDQTIGILATIGEVTQKSMDSVGESLKTLLSRYGNVKAGVFTNMGLDDDGETTENINDIEKVMRQLGIAVRNSRMEMRSISDVLDELAEKWGTLDSVTKNAVATAFAGVRQRENFNVMMENYDRVKELTEESRNSEGTADTKYEAYLNSVQAAIKELQNAWEELTQKLEASTIIKKGLTWLAAIIRNLDKIASVLGTVFTFIATAKLPGWLMKLTQSIWGGGQLLTGFLKAFGQDPKLFVMSQNMRVDRRAQKRIDKMHSGGMEIFGEGGMFATAKSVRAKAKSQKMALPDPNGKSSLIGTKLKPIADSVDKVGSKAQTIIDLLREHFGKADGAVDNGEGDNPLPDDLKELRAKGGKFTYEGGKLTIKTTKVSSFDELSEEVKGGLKDSNTFTGSDGTLYTKNDDGTVSVMTSSQYDSSNFGKGSQGAYYRWSAADQALKDLEGKEDTQEYKDALKERDQAYKAYKKSSMKEQAGSKIVSGVVAGVMAGVTAGMQTQQVSDSQGHTVDATTADKLSAGFSSGAFAGVMGAALGPMGAALGQMIGGAIGDAANRARHQHEFDVQAAVETAQKNIEHLDAIRDAVKAQTDVINKDVLGSEDYQALMDMKKTIQDQFAGDKDLRAKFESELLNYVKSNVKNTDHIQDTVTSIDTLYDALMSGDKEERRQAMQAAEVASLKAKREDQTLLMNQKRSAAKKQAEEMRFDVHSIEQAAAIAYNDNTLAEKKKEIQKDYDATLGVAIGLDAAAAAQAGISVGLLAGGVTAIGSLILAGTAAATAGAAAATHKKAESIGRELDAWDDNVNKLKALVDEYDALQQEMKDIDAEIAFADSGLGYMTEAELKELTLQGAIDLVADSLEKEGIVIRDLTGAITTQWKRAIEDQIKQNTNMDKILRGGTLTIGGYKNAVSALEARINKYNKTTGQTITLEEARADMAYLIEHRTKANNELLKAYAIALGYVEAEESDEAKILAGIATMRKEVYATDEDAILRIANGLHMSTEKLLGFGDVVKYISFADVQSSLDDLISSSEELLGYWTSFSSTAGLTTEAWAKIGQTNSELFNDLLNSDSTTMGDVLAGAVEGKLLLSKNKMFSQVLTNETRYDSFREGVFGLKGDIGTDLYKALTNAKTMEGVFNAIRHASKEDQEKLEPLMQEFFNFSIKVDVNTEMLDEAIKWQTHQLEEQINALTEQKDALSKINDERKKELELIKAREALENASKEKKRVYRAGVGFTYEQDDQAVTEAKSKLEELDIQKQQEQFQMEIDRLELEKQILEKIPEDLKWEALQESYESWAERVGLTETNIEEVVSNIADMYTLMEELKGEFFRQQYGETNDTLEQEDNKLADLINGTKEGVKVDDSMSADWSKMEGHWDEVSFEELTRLKNLGAGKLGVTNYNNLIDIWDSRKEAIQEQAKVANAAGDLDPYAAFRSENKEDFSVEKGLMETSRGVSTVSARLKSADIQGYGSRESAETNDIDVTVTDIDGKEKTFDLLLGPEASEADKKALGPVTKEMQGDPENGGLVVYDGKLFLAGKDGVWHQMWGDHDTIEDLLKYMGYEESVDGTIDEESKKKHAGGTYSTPTAESALINEQGTEAIITPEGTITALPAKTGIVPADITKNLWELGEVAPTLVARLRGMTPFAAGNNGSVTNNDGTFIDNLVMTIYPTKDYDMDRFIAEAKARARLTRHNN